MTNTVLLGFAVVAFVDVALVEVDVSVVIIDVGVAVVDVDVDVALVDVNAGVSLVVVDVIAGVVAENVDMGVVLLLNSALVVEAPVAPVAVDIVNTEIGGVAVALMELIITVPVVVALAEVKSAVMVEEIVPADDVVSGSTVIIGPTVVNVVVVVVVNETDREINSPAMKFQPKKNKERRNFSNAAGRDKINATTRPKTACAMVRNEKKPAGGCVSRWMPLSFVEELPRRPSPRIVGDTSTKIRAKDTSRMAEMLWFIAFQHVFFSFK